MEPSAVRDAVIEFRERTAHGEKTEHSFAPWYLHQTFHIPEAQAIEQSSDGSYDFGIDAFHLYEGDSPRKLLLVQAKFSDSLNLISSGIRGFRKGLPELAGALETGVSEIPLQNKVLVNLRAALNQLDPETRDVLELDFHVIHLSIEDRTIVGNRTREARGELRDALSKHFPDRTCVVRDLGPADFGPPGDVIVPPKEVPLVVHSLKEFPAGPETLMYYGVGRLAGLVDLYTSRRDNLFARNVRYYLYSKKNTEKGPAGKMRETLKQICIEKRLDPEFFALYHNGITLHTTRATPENGRILVSDPYVLNGCQTIKNAWLFRHKPEYKDKIDGDRWARIAVPLRIIQTTDENLIRDVTRNNNRQNAMTSAALRANDRIQIDLEERFQRKGVLYERQEGAYENLVMTNPEILEEEFHGSRGGAVDIVDLSRSIAAVAGELRLAERPNDLFEYDKSYESCFSDRRLSSITFLVFLQNLHDTIGVVLKKDLNLHQDGSGPKPSRLKFYAMCLLVRYVTKKNLRDFVLNHGEKVYGGRDRAFRKQVATLLGTRQSGIRGELARRFLTLESTEGAKLKESFEAAARSLRLRADIDPFTAFRDIDDEFERSEN